MFTSLSVKLHLWKAVKQFAWPEEVSADASLLLPFLVIGGHVLDAVEWVIFWAIGPILWTNGLWMFINSTLSPARKIIWVQVLIAAGTVVGYLLTMNMIRDKFVLLLLALPLLAVADVTLARSTRRFLFWFRACAFEICTVFGTAAMVRYTLDMLKAIANLAHP